MAHLQGMGSGFRYGIFDQFDYPVRNSFAPSFAGDSPAIPYRWRQSAAQRGPGLQIALPTSRSVLTPVDRWRQLQRDRSSEQEQNLTSEDPCPFICWDKPCLSCTSLVDGFDRTWYQVTRHAAFVAIATMVTDCAGFRIGLSVSGASLVPDVPLEYSAMESS
jgi:hypothetical protein